MACLEITAEAQPVEDVGSYGLLGSNTRFLSVKQYSTFLVLLHLCGLPTIWVGDGVGGPWVS